MTLSNRSAGQDVSDIFTGGLGARSTRTTEKGIPSEHVPAFVAGEELADLADVDSRIVVMTADLGSSNRLIDFRARHPERFIQMGIAEKNMVTTAAGLASVGFVPYVGTFASFAALLCFEQIRTDCAYPGMPVRILGHHSGISLGFYGSSHHSLEDLSALRSVANLMVACAADANELRAMLRASLNYPGPIYLRLGRGRDPKVYSEVPQHFQFGKAIQLCDGTDGTIIATGSEVNSALGAAALLEVRGIKVRVIDMHTIAPLDVAAVVAAAMETAAIITVEEHNITGGLGGAVAEVLADRQLGVPFKRHGIPDEYSLIGPPAALYAHYRLDAAGIALITEKFIRTSKL